MIVEDELFVAWHLEDILRDLKFEVCGIVPDGEGAIEKASELRVDLILMDIHLSGKIDGIEAAQQIRQNSSAGIVFMLTVASVALHNGCHQTEAFMRILAVSVARPTIVRYRGKDVATGIYKEQVSGPQRVLRDNIEGDQQSDLRVHGGFDKAVYAFPREHYSFYEEFLGQTCFAFGYFGENLTTEGMLESEVRIGDQYQVGDVILEVSQPRSPCFKFGLKMGTSRAIKTCLSSGKTGFYLRVLREGSLQGGDIVQRLLTHSAAPTVEETHRLYYFDKQNMSGLRTALQTQALAQVWKDEFAARLRTLGHSSCMIPPLRLGRSMPGLGRGLACLR